MTIISQLLQFIFYKNQVQDIEYNPRFATLSILADALPLFLLIMVINNSGLTTEMPVINDAGQTEVRMVSISYVSTGLALIYTVLFTGLFYVFYAAQEKQARFVQGATAFFGASAILTLANLIITPLPGAGILGIVILGFKVSVSVRVMTESLGYGVARAALSLIGISIIAMLIAIAIFPPDLTIGALVGEAAL